MSNRIAISTVSKFSVPSDALKLESDALNRDKVDVKRSIHVHVLQFCVNPKRPLSCEAKKETRSRKAKTKHNHHWDQRW